MNLTLMKSIFLLILMIAFILISFFIKDAIFSNLLVSIAVIIGVFVIYKP